MDLQYNNCCTFQTNQTHANLVVQRINEALPSDQDKLTGLLVLFATFNQGSTFTAMEGSIAESTIVRLLRTFHGIEEFKASNPTRYGGFDEYFADWPDNSMVISDNALIDLFEPFGEGLIQGMVKMIKRDS